MNQHLCLSTRADLLTRWRQAFPTGRVSASLSSVTLETGPLLVWLHAGALPQATLQEAIRTVGRQLPRARMVVLSSTPDQGQTLAAFRAGARGLCHVQATPQLLQQIATVVSNGGLWVGPELMSRMIATAGKTLSLEPRPQATDRLTDREREVALAAGRGISNKEVAALLEITERTVKAHMGSIFAKLGVRDRLHLVLVLNQAEADAVPALSERKSAQG